MKSCTMRLFLLLLVLQLAAITTPVLSTGATNTGGGTRGKKSRTTLYRPAAAYKWLYPVHAAADAVIVSLNDLQHEVVHFCRMLFTYFAIYHDIYYMISKLIMTILTKLYNLCHRLLLLSFNHFPMPSAITRRFFTSSSSSTQNGGHVTNTMLMLSSIHVKYFVVVLFVATVVAFCALSESSVARRVRRVSAFVVRLFMVPPVFVTMDVTPVVHGLLYIVSKSVRVVVAVLVLVFTIVRVALMTVLTGGPVVMVGVVVSMVVAGVVAWRKRGRLSLRRPSAHAVTDPDNTSSSSSSTATITDLLSNTSTTPLSSGSTAQRQSAEGDDIGNGDRNGNMDGQSATTSAAAADKMSCCSGCRQNNNNNTLPVDREIVDVDIDSTSHPSSSSSSSNDVAQEGLRQRRTASSTPPVG